MKLEFLLCNEHALELQKRFGTDAVKISKPVPWITSYCSEKMCRKKLYHANSEVTFDIEKVSCE